MAVRPNFLFRIPKFNTEIPKIFIFLHIITICLPLKTPFVFSYLFLLKILIFFFFLRKIFTGNFSKKRKKRNIIRKGNKKSVIIKLKLAKFNILISFLSVKSFTISDFCGGLIKN